MVSVGAGGTRNGAGSGGWAKSRNPADPWTTFGLGNFRSAFLRQLHTVFPHCMVAVLCGSGTTLLDDRHGQDWWSDLSDAGGGLGGERPAVGWREGPWRHARPGSRVPWYLRVHGCGELRVPQ